jgi:hypothetical protein
MLTEEQLYSENVVIAGALKSKIHLRLAKKRHIRVQEKTQEGMRPWAEIVQEFDMRGNRSVFVEKHETQVTIKFDQKYPGGNTGFIWDYEDTFVELKALNVHYDDQRCMALLLQNFLIPDDNKWMVAHCESKFKHDFVEACSWL